MIWTRLSLTGKLLVAVITPVVIAVFLIAGTIAYSMREGFDQYLLDTEVTQYGDLAQALGADAAEDWSTLQDPTRWEALVARYIPDDHMPPPPPPGRPPDRPGPRFLSDRLALISAQGTVLAGRGGGESWADLPVRDATGAQVASLRLYGAAELSNGPGRLFVQRQLRAIASVALIAFIGASAVAFLTARQFLSPIHRIGRHVARLASGDLSSRLDARRRDELGQMMKDQNALARRLESNRRRERQWVSDTSHELKTPLSVLRAEIEAMQDGIRSATPETLGSMHQAVMRLSRLVDDLRLLAIGDEASLELRRGQVDLGALVQGAVADARKNPLCVGLDVTVDAERGVMVDGDPGRLRQVLDNLLNNACRYTDAPGKLRVSCHRSGAFADIRVEDSAPCPPTDSLSGLFDRFARGETSRSRDHGGSGLGLSICQSLVEAHRGTIEATPSNLGGLCLHVLLPLTSEPEHD